MYNVNKQFNRVESRFDNFYISNYGHNFDVSNEYSGHVKCKLLHSQYDSIIFPDQIYISTLCNEFNWIQPLSFLVNLLIEEGDIVYCSFYIDISDGRTLRIEFNSSDLITTHQDNSSLFVCKIYGPENLAEYCTGSGYFEDNIPYLKLYHHTLPRYKDLIIKDKEFRLSKWNIQGTKKLANIHYLYITCLDKISQDGDLKQIAMASDGRIHLTLDNIDVPTFFEPSKTIENIKRGIVVLDVYRESTNNRKATIDLFIDATLLSPKHLWKHYPNDRAVFYEVCMPFIFRIGARPDSCILIDNNKIHRQHNIVTLEYQVVGDATKFDGLKAPYDEENTEHIFKIENLHNDVNILKFWVEHTNSDQYSNKDVITQEFEK